MALYLLASSLAGFDQRKLAIWEILGRLGFAVMIMSFSTTLQIVGIIGAFIMIVWHSTSTRKGYIEP